MRIISMVFVIKLAKVNSLKEKRNFSKFFINYVRKNANVSIAEVGSKNIRKILTLGIVSVSSEKTVLEKLFVKISKFIERTEDIEIFSNEMELF